MNAPGEGPDAPVSDEELLAAVGRLLRGVDPMPHGLVERVRFALDLDTVEVELSRLVERRELAAARTDELTRLVTFQSDSLSIMITVEPRVNGTARIDGWLTPAACHHIELRCPSHPMSTESDDAGRFSLDAVPAGIMQLVVHLSGTGRRVVTPTMEI